MCSAFAAPDDELRFAEETEHVQADQSWKILIVDDEAEVHTITQLALSDFTFAGRSLTFLSAYSAQEAQQLIQAHPDIAIILLDVVMETENAGLHLVDYIRTELDNPLVRIILRTGQPGQAPEQVVAVHYAIDDYKTKTELTAQKLTITVVTALRAFATLMKMLALTRDLEAEIVQQKQAELAVRMNEMTAIAKAQQLEETLHTLRQSQQQWVQREKINPAPMSAEIAQKNDPSPADGMQSMSVLARMARTVLRITDEHSAKLGLSQTKLDVLMYLGNALAQCASPSALAKHCGVSRAAMTGLLDGLEQDGYVDRDSHPSDRRALMIKLTPKGQQFLSGIVPQDDAQIAELIQALSEAERQTLNELALKLTVPPNL
ncbi:MAG: MarR family transcriptional regulator [Thermosynechococcaceae cyanobacterium]